MLDVRYHWLISRSFSHPDPVPVAEANSLADIVPRAAAIAPEMVALVGEGIELTWRQVERRTALLAAALLSSGVVQGDRVAVARRKSPESFVAVHAILRAGAVVVPIDPLSPPAMARQVLDDAHVRAVLGDAQTIAALDPWAAVEHEIIVMTTDFLDDDRVVRWPETDSNISADPLPSVHPDDVSYIIYTSGSTGRPKGIVHTHRSALAYATRAVTEYRIGPDDRLAGMNPLHFDMSTLELYAAPLAVCAVVVMAETDLQFPAGLTQRSAEHGVTIWYTVPFLLRSVLERGGLDRRPLPALRSVLYGGEPFPGGALRQLMNRLPGVGFINVYGPAEVNACTHHHLTDASEVGDDVPIGRPWAGVDIRVVDEVGRDVACGDQGELWVSAPTVMQRYWGLDELSAGRLTHRDDGPDWYATGDVVVEDEDGVLWFRGRRDHQVKVRGVRIELEGIESVLTNAPGVLHAVAGPIGPPGNASHVVAAVVLQEGAANDMAPIRRWCRERLPSIAVPRTIEARPDMPTTASGKIDRRLVRAELRDTDS